MSKDQSPDAFPEWMLVVNAAIDPAVEQEWNDWYDQIHLPEILGCPGFVDASRYVTADHRGQRRYGTIYRLSSADAITTTEFSERRGWAQFAAHVEASVRLFQRIGDEQ